MFELVSFGLTDVGKTREVNEDSFLVAPPVLAVADGMGGHSAGEVASAAAITELERFFAGAPGTENGGRLVEKAIARANDSVFGKARTNPRFRSMGTTLTILYSDGSTAWIGNVGDSRTYHLSGGVLKQITRDDSFVQQLVDEGEITPEEARVHPQRHIITRALGLGEEVHPDPIPVAMNEGDLFLLASDGLTEMIDDASIGGVLLALSDPEAAAAELVRLALEAGGSDNVTVVVAKVVVAGSGAPRANDELTASFTPVPVIETTPRNGEGGDASLKNDGVPYVEKGPLSTGIRSWRIWAISIALILFLLLGGGLFLYRSSFYVGVKNGKVAIFQGFSFWGHCVEETDLEVELLPEMYRSRLENGQDSGSRKEADEVVASLEEQVSTVPKLKGLTVDEAKRLLREAGLKATIAWDPDSTAPRGEVLQQGIDAGRRLRNGSKVTITVAGTEGEV